MLHSTSPLIKAPPPVVLSPVILIPKVLSEDRSVSTLLVVPYLPNKHSTLQCIIKAEKLENHEAVLQGVLGPIPCMIS